MNNKTVHSVIFSFFTTAIIVTISTIVGEQITFFDIMLMMFIIRALYLIDHNK